MESDSGESTVGIIDLSQLSKLSAASPAVLYSTQQSSTSCYHDGTSGVENQGEAQGNCECKETTGAAGTPPVGWHDENPLTILGSSQEFSLIEDEKFDFLIPDEYLDESIDGTSGSDQHKDSSSRAGGIMACSSPILQSGCPKQSAYDKALLQLKYRGRADLILNHYQQKQPRKRGEEEEEEGEVSPVYASVSVDVPEEIAGGHSQADSLHDEVAALDIMSSLGVEDNSHCGDSGEGKSSSSLLIDLEVSPSAPPPKLNSTVTLDVDSVVLEGEGTRQRNTTFTLIDCPFEGSTSAAVEEMANSGSDCTSEEEGQRPSKLPTLAKRTQASLVNVTVQSSDYAIMRDIWKEQMQADQGLVSNGRPTTTANNLAPEMGTTTTTHPGGAAECTVSVPVGAAFPSSLLEKDTFVKEPHGSSSNASSSSSPAKELELTTTKTLGSDGSSDSVPLSARGSLRPPSTAHPQLAYPKGKFQPKGKSQLSTAPKTRQMKWTEASQAQNTTTILKGAHNHKLTAVPRRPKSILKTPKRHLLPRTQTMHMLDSLSGAKSSSDVTRTQQKKNALPSPNTGSEEKVHKPVSLHRASLDVPSFSVSTMKDAGMLSHYQSTPMHTATPKYSTHTPAPVQQPFRAVQPDFSLSSIEGSDPAHRVVAAQKTITPLSQNRRRSGIPTSASLDKATARPMSAQKPHRTREPDPSLSPQLPKAPPMRKSLHQPKAIPRIALHDRNGPSSTARGPLVGKAKTVRTAASGVENRRRSKLAVPKGQHAT